MITDKPLLHQKDKHNAMASSSSPSDDDDDNSVEANVQKETLGMMDLLCNDPQQVAGLLLLTSDKDDKRQMQKELRGICSELFQRIEGLNSLRGRLAGSKQDEEPPLSGLTELYTGQEEAEDDTAAVDAETLFGQIELLNKTLTSKVKKTMKKISISLEGGGGVVRLLEDDDDDDDEQNGEPDSDDQNDDDDSQEEREQSGDEDEKDENRKRIEARMKRAMADMDEDDDDDENSGSSNEKNKDADDAASSEEESMVDPAAEELNDGFFDINEMEKFADEEEEYLPDEAFGEEKADEGNDANDDDDEHQDKRSFHQKQRDGDIDDSDEEDSSDEEANQLLFKKETTIRRKRYRDEEEIDALYELYQGSTEHDQYDGDDDDDDDSAMDAVNMTAADLYGKPNKKYYEKWNSKKTKKAKKSDDDSWDEFDFKDSKEMKRSGWNDENMGLEKKEQDDSESDSEEESDADSVGGDDGGDDEQVPMKSGPGKREKAEVTSTKKADKLTKQTEEFERELLAEKPWQMRGETVGTARPVESLLDSTPEFEVATKQAPIITVEKTMSLEEIIKKRILNEDWDNVVPRELPDVAWNKKRGELPEVSQEKSKLGLGELYEREYMKKALGYDADKSEKATEEEKAKNEMKSLFANLCSKLDALSNYHFAPRPIADEAEIRPVTKPAIAMEEVLPLHVSDARGVAPEEVYAGKRGRDAVLRGESELEQQDRKRLRAAKKAARRKARKEKLADEKLISKLQPGLGLNNPYEKRKMREELSVARAQGKVTKGQADTNNYGGSGTFFQRMQQEAQQSIKGAHADPDPQSKKKQRSKSNAVKL